MIPANLTRFIPIRAKAIHEELVLDNFALIRSRPYALFPSPKNPSIGFLSPGLKCSFTAEGLPSFLPINLTPIFLGVHDLLLCSIFDLLVLFRVDVLFAFGTTLQNSSVVVPHCKLPSLVYL